MPEQVKGLYPLGRVIGIHGLRGDLKVRTHPADQAALLAARQVFLRQEAPIAYPLEFSREHKGNVLLHLEGIDSAAAAEALVGQELLVDPAGLKRSAGQLYWFEIAGAEVVDRDRGAIGSLEGMFITAAHGIYVVEGRFGEVMIPAVAPFVLGYDPARRILSVDVPEGLYPESA